MPDFAWCFFEQETQYAKYHLTKLLIKWVLFEGESDFWVKFGTIERGGGFHNVSHATECFFFFYRRI